MHFPQAQIDNLNYFMSRCIISQQGQIRQDNGAKRHLGLIISSLVRYGLLPSSIKLLNQDGNDSDCSSDETCLPPRKNFNYRVHLHRPAAYNTFSSLTQPCTTRPRFCGISTLVMRIAADSVYASSVDHIQNQVAAMYLARTTLRERTPLLGEIVPAVYAWHTGSDNSPGWIMMEDRPGLPLGEHFAEMASYDRRDMVEQMAEVFASLQATQVPDTVRGHGRLAINMNYGAIISSDDAEARDATADMVIEATDRPRFSPPLLSSKFDRAHRGYSEYWAQRLRNKLDAADDSQVCQGWRLNGVRDCVERFIAEGVDQVLHAAGVDQNLRAFVHGDFSTSNFLFDPDTNRITALLDFDAACITHPCHEFFSSLADVGGSSHAHDGDEDLREAVMTGVFTRRLRTRVYTGFGSDDYDEVDGPPDSTKSEYAVEENDDDEEDYDDAWSLARAWDAQLAARGALRPCTIAGMAALEALRMVEEGLCPPRLACEPFLAGRSADEVRVEREQAEAALMGMVGWWTRVWDWSVDQAVPSDEGWSMMEIEGTR